MEPRESDHPGMRDDYHPDLIVPAKKKDPIFQLADVVRETGFSVHRWFRNGFLEKVYENSMAHRLAKKGLRVEKQFHLPVFDEDGTNVGDFYADLLVEGQLLVELKACKALGNEHVAQVLGYLRASRVEHGLLLNFGAPKFQARLLTMSHDRFESDAF